MEKERGDGYVICALLSTKARLRSFPNQGFTAVQRDVTPFLRSIGFETDMICFFPFPPASVDSVETRNELNDRSIGKWYLRNVLRTAFERVYIYIYIYKASLLFGKQATSLQGEINFNRITLFTVDNYTREIDWSPAFPPGQIQSSKVEPSLSLRYNPMDRKTRHGPHVILWTAPRSNFIAKRRQELWFGQFRMVVLDRRSEVKREFRKEIRLRFLFDIFI